jgi:hypothetical protein
VFSLGTLSGFRGITIHSLFQSGDLNSVISGLGGGTTPDTSTEGIFDTILELAQWGVYILAGVAVLFLVYGGIRWGTDAGDGKGAEAGKKIVINAVIGLVIAALSIVIIQVVLVALSAFLSPTPQATQPSPNTQPLVPQ